MKRSCPSENESQDLEIIKLCPVPGPLNVEEVWTHANCPDGRGVVCCVKLFEKLFREGLLPSIKIVYLKHGDPIPSGKDKEIAVFDISFNEEITLRLISEAKSFAVFDHHIGNKLVMETFKGNCFFNNDRSGVRLAWHYFFGEKATPPKWVTYVEARDLGNFNNKEAMRFSAYLQHVVETESSNSDTAWLDALYSVANWDIMRVMLGFEEPKTLEMSNTILNRKDPSYYGIVGADTDYREMLSVGKTCKKTTDSIIKKQVSFVKKTRFCGLIAGITNTCNFVSETASQFLETNKECDIAIIYFTIYGTNNPVHKFSLRSRKVEDGNPNTIPCHLIASLFGGGGHQAAAGFNLQTSTNITDFLKDNINNTTWKQTNNN